MGLNLRASQGMCEPKLRMLHSKALFCSKLSHGSTSGTSSDCHHLLFSTEILHIPPSCGENECASLPSMVVGWSPL